MDVGTGATNDNNIADADVPASEATVTPEVTTTEDATAKLRLAIKTPKEKKDISIDASSTVKQVHS